LLVPEPLGFPAARAEHSSAFALPELLDLGGKASRSRVRVAVVGAGLGGTTLAALLVAGGFDVTVYEQAPALSALGAGIHLGPNVVKVLRALGIGDELLSISNVPDAWVSRDSITGDRLFRLEFDAARYGAPYLTVHRGRFHELLTGLVPKDRIALNKRLVGIDDSGEAIELAFDDGSRACADIVVGADGLNSKVRELLLGEERPVFTGNVSYRADYPAHLLVGVELDDVTKWWGPGRSVIVYFLDWRRETVYFVADVPQPVWTADRSFVPGDLEELHAAFEDCHPDLVKILKAAPETSKWGMFEREPLPLWSRSRIVLLGDACHPMRPHMGQGAAMAIEDGAVLARCLLANEPGDHSGAFAQYEATRRDRASAVQAESKRNRWLKAEYDPLWVYGYDAINVPLEVPRANGA
jgi:6-hydroxynicotinate 3-monooxygenase